MPVSAEQMRELMALGLEGETLLEVVTIFERDVSRDGRDGKALAAERARRYRARQAEKKRGMAAPDSDAARHAERHVTHSVTERDETLSFYPSSLPLVLGKEVAEKKGSTALVVEGQKRAKRKSSVPLPDDWTPKPAHYEAAAKRGLTAATVDDQAEAMRHWAKSKDERKADWDATFHGFVRRFKEQKNGFGGPRPLQDDEKSSSRAAGRLADAARRGEFSFGPRPSLLPGPDENAVQLLPKG